MLSRVLQIRMFLGKGFAQRVFKAFNSVSNKKTWIQFWLFLNTQWKLEINPATVSSNIWKYDYGFLNLLHFIGNFYDL